MLRESQKPKKYFALNNFCHLYFSVVVTTIIVHVCSANARDEYTGQGWFYRTESELTDVPNDIPDEAVGVYLNNNNITRVKAGSFSKLSICVFISLASNFISEIEVGAFQGMDSMNEMWLGWNNLTILKANMFQGLLLLRKLTLSNNQINDTQAGAFNGLPNLQELYLYGNKFTTLKANMFAGLHSLELIILTYNHISTIEVGTFTGLGTLKKLWMDHNNEKLRDMKDNTFIGLSSLEILYVHNNKIQSVRPGLFNGLFKLKEIGLDDNNITQVEDGAFQGLEFLSKLWLFNNRLTTLQSNTFTGLPRPLDLTLGENPLQCDQRLCWIKRGEREGWIRWISLDDRPLQPKCSNGMNWYNLTLDCPQEGRRNTVYSLLLSINIFLHTSPYIH